MSATAAVTNVSETIDAAFQTHRSELWELATAIHSHPELALQEHFAHQTLCDLLERHGFQVTRHYLGLETAFLATFEVGSGATSEHVPTIAFLAEYDALPGIGHACGHSLISTAAIAAGLATKELLATLKQDGGPRKRLLVMGTPAEEALGGKCMLLKKGAFKDIDAALMVHPTITPPVVHCTSLAIAELRIVYRGQTSHASALPWEGLNALDALVTFYNSISCLRQQLKPNMRIHGIIVDGGKAPNIIPDRSEGMFYIRAGTKEELEGLNERVVNCARAAALSTGCTVELIWEGTPFLDVKTNPVVAEVFGRCWNNPDVGTIEEQLNVPLGSTDMGNVSYAVPGLHALYPIPAKLGNHTKEFAEAAGTPEAFECTLSVARPLAQSAFELFLQPDLLAKAKEFYDYSGFQHSVIETA